MFTIPSMRVSPVTEQSSLQNPIHMSLYKRKALFHSVWPLSLYPEKTGGGLLTSFSNLNGWHKVDPWRGRKRIPREEFLGTWFCSFRSKTMSLRKGHFDSGGSFLMPGKMDFTLSFLHASSLGMKTWLCFWWLACETSPSRNEKLFFLWRVNPGANLGKTRLKPVWRWRKRWLKVAWKIPEVHLQEIFQDRERARIGKWEIYLS